MNKAANTFRSVSLKLVYVLVVGAAIVIGLEVVARGLGLGDPILYYNAAWGGMRPVPNQQVERLRDATVTIDSNGYRSASVPTGEALRILYIGDSVTWSGTSIDDEQSFPEIAASVLRKELSVPVYAMNAGVNGASVVNQAEIFLDAETDVDVLVWVIPWGDVYRTYQTLGYLWPASVKPRFALVEAMDHVIRTVWLQSFRRGSPVGEDWTQINKEAGSANPWTIALLERRRMKNFHSMETALESARSRNVPVIFAITPEYIDGELQPHSAGALAKLRELEDMDITVVDLMALFESHPDPGSLFMDHMHYEIEGHRVVGEALGERLKSILEPAVPEAPGNVEHP